MSSILLVKRMFTSLSILVWRYAPAISAAATAFLAAAAYARSIIVESRCMVGDVASSFEIYACWHRPSTHVRPFMNPSHFTLTNVSAGSAYFLMFQYSNSLSTRLVIFQPSICMISFRTAIRAFLPSTLITLSTDIWFRPIQSSAEKIDFTQAW